MIVCWIFLALLLQAQTPEAVDTDAAEPPATLLVDEVRRIGASVEILRAETFARPLEAVRVPDDVRQAAAEIRALNVLPRGRLQARGRAWSDVGLGRDDSAKELFLTLATDLDDIGLDPEGRTLLVSLDRLDLADFEPTDGPADPATVLMLTGMRPDEPLVCHFLVHILQRERSGRDSLEQTTDRLLASMAWAEGEANLTAALYLFHEISVRSDVLSFVRTPGDVLDGSLLPSNLHRMLGAGAGLAAFVYLEGFDQAVELYRAGGWEALNEGMAQRRTTRDLLHPELPALPGADFPDPPDPPRSGVRLADVDSLGEQAIVVLVSTRTGKDSLGLLAGEGWAGDRLYRWELEDGSGDGASEWITRWTTSGSDASRSAEQNAEDFDYAFGRTLEARFPGRSLEPRGPGVRTLNAGQRTYRIERRGAEVRVLAAPASWGASSTEP